MVLTFSVSYSRSVSLERVGQMYRAINGVHPMSDEDDAYVRTNFVEIPDAEDYPREVVLELIANGKLPLPAYLLADGTPMVHPDYLEPLRSARSVESLKSWFTGHWSQQELATADEEWSEGYLSGQYVCLWSVTPATIQAKTAAIETIKVEVAAIQQGGGSRTRLRSAVADLDALEPPFTTYDRLRFGARTSREVWIDDITELYLDHVEP